MPLITWAAAAYAAALGICLVAGTATRTGLATLLLAAVVAAVLAKRQRVALLTAVAAAASLVAIAAAGHDAACARLLVRRTEWAAELADDVSAGDVAHASLRAEGCAQAATVLVVNGHGAAGDLVRLSGRATTGTRGLLVDDAMLGARIGHGGLLALRAAAGRRIDRVFGRDAPMARALVIADMSGIPAEQRDRFARGGLVHMLSVSGLHVAVIALALELLCSALRLPPVPSRLGALALLAAYVAMIGAPPPAVRAAVMLALLLATRMLQRPTSPWAILAVGCAAPLLQPTVVLDLGWQLSAAGTAALIAGGALARRIVPGEWSGSRRAIARGLTVSVVATVVTAPLVAWTFGRVSLVAPLSNLVADPVMGLLQPALFLALCVPVAPVERAAADASHALITAFDRIAGTAAALPGAAPVVLPSALAAGAGAVLSVALIAACVRRRPVPALLAGASALCVMIAEPWLMPTRGFTELHMLDVGQGDALALRTRAGRWVVIDAGSVWDGGDAGRSTVVPYLAHRGGAVALFVLSHPHADHVGGAASLIGTLHPARFLDPGYVGTTPSYRAALAAAREAHIPWQRARPGDSLVVDEAVITVLAPDSAWASALADANLASTVLLVRVGAVRLLLTGDAEAPEEEWLLAHDRDALRADVLKVGHHGSRTSSTPDFLAAVRPRLALVSVGAHNSYGLPNAEVLAALHAGGSQLVRTDRSGTVVVRTDGMHIEVETSRGEARWSLR